MSVGSYEGLVGWRYLLRAKKRPLFLILGLVIVGVGAALVGGGVYTMLDSGESLSVFATGMSGARMVAAVGMGIVGLGAVITLFGLLNTYLTVISAFSTFMVTIGVAEVILVLGVMNGFQGDLRNKIIDTYAHVVIEPAEGLEYLDDYRALAESARGVHGVLGATPTLQAEVMLSAPTNLAPVVLQGIDTGTVSEANKVRGYMKQGTLEFLDEPELLERALRGKPRRPTPAEAAMANPEDAPAPEDDTELADAGMEFPAPAAAKPGPPPSLLMGVELRRNLALWLGETINVISPHGDVGPNGPVPKSRPFRLAGWFQSGMLDFDTKLAYASLAEVQRYIGVGDVAGAIQLRVADLDAAPQIAAAVRAALGPSVKVSDWGERNSNLFSALKLEKIAMFLVLSINILLAAFSITSTLVMTIIERKREVAILMAMGSTKRSIVRIFMSQGAFTGVVGSVLGTAVGLSGAIGLSMLRLPLNTDVYYISAIPVDVRVTDVVAIVVVALLVSLVSTIYPALYAASLRPVEGLSAT